MDTKTEENLRFILGRRSIRVFAPGEVSDALVTRLLEAAMANAGVSPRPHRAVCREIV